MEKKRGAPVAGQAEAEDMTVTQMLGKKPDDANTRNLILKASIDTFARHGFDGASLSKIAKAADVGHPLIHYYFGSKENLWREAMEFAFGSLLDAVARVDDATGDLAPIDRLRAMIRGFTHFAARNPSHLNLIMSEMRVNSERREWLHLKYTSVLPTSLTRIINDAQASGEIREIPPAHLTSIIIGSVVLFFSVNSSLSEDVDIHELADRHADFVLETLLDGLRR